MNEKQTSEENSESEEGKQGEDKSGEKTSKNSEEGGDKSEILSPIERADKTLKRMEEENKKMEKNIKRIEELEARRVLGGKSGGQAPQKKEEESPKDYAKRVMKGEL